MSAGLAALLLKRAIDLLRARMKHNIPSYFISILDCIMYHTAPIRVTLTSVTECGRMKGE